MSVLWKFKSLLIFMSMSVGHAHSHNVDFANLSLQDTTGTDSIPAIDTLAELKPLYELDLPKFNNLRNMKANSLITANSLQQYIKGELPGVYVSESSGEPGSNIQMFVRGISKPILNNRDIYNTQPLVVLDGVPLIGEHPFAFDVQNFDIERIGTENNLLGNIDFDNIQSIKVLKDLSAVATYGPLGANGVIEITSRKTEGDGDKRITVNISLRIKIISIID